MFRLPMLSALLLVLSSGLATGQKADGVALIELDNASAQPVEAFVGETKYTVKANSSHKVFLTPGTYECRWGDSEKLTCHLRHGDITVIQVGNLGAVAKPKEIEKEKEVPKGPIVVIPEDILKPPPKREKEPIVPPKKEDEKPLAPPPKPATPPPKKEAEEKPQPNAATIKVFVPKGAVKLKVDGQAMKTLDTSERVEYKYFTPSLRPGLAYYYDFTLEMNNGSQYRRRVFVYANHTTTVDFR